MGSDIEMDKQYSTKTDFTAYTPENWDQREYERAREDEIRININNKV